MSERAPKIGVVGAGIAGLHLGLLLQQAGIEATIFTEQTPEQVRANRLPNVVVRSASTRERERQLGVAHWDALGVDLTHYAFHLAGEHPLAFTGVFDQPAMSVDLRLYCARLLEDFIQRGGDVRYGMLQADDLARLSGKYDLVVAATGRGALGALFPRIAERSPFSAPQRLCVGGLFRGVALERRPALGVTIVRGHGEILSFPVYSFEPGLTGIAFESIEVARSRLSRACATRTIPGASRQQWSICCRHTLQRSSAHRSRHIRAQPPAGSLPRGDHADSAGRLHPAGQRQMRGGARRRVCGQRPDHRPGGQHRRPCGLDTWRGDL